MHHREEDCFLLMKNLLKNKYIFLCWQVIFTFDKVPNYKSKHPFIYRGVMMKKLALICLLSASLISAGTAFAAKYPSVAIVNNTQTDISFDYKVCNAGE